MKTQVILSGGTGLVGSALLDLLLTDREIDKVLFLVRSGTNRQHPKLKELIINYDHLEDYSGEIKGKAVFCCLGTTIKKARTKENFRRVDYLYPFELAKIAKENQIPQFNIITAMGADKSSIVFYNKVKGEVEEAIEYLGFESLNIFRPSLLMGDRKEQRMGEKAGILLAKVINPIMVGSLRKYRGISAENVAQAMYNVFKQGEKGHRIFQSDEIYDIASQNTIYR